MPVAEPVTLQPEKVSLRHVGPRAVVWPGVTTPIGPSAAVLTQTLYARPLPFAELTSSPDVANGSYTTRLEDAGEFQIVVPNAVSSDGIQWRTRFDPTGHLQWVEVWYEGELESVLCLDTVNPTDSAGYSSTLDATDFVASLWGNGASIQTESTGQLQAMIYDAPTVLASLFDVQGWQDFSDAAFPSLLQGLLNAALGLRLTPWQHLAVSDPSSAGSVTVHGQDGMFLLRKAYERDWTVTQAPRDVIERGTQVWVPLLATAFPAGSATPPFTVATAGTFTTTAWAQGGLTIAATGGVATAGSVTLTNQVAYQALGTASGVWRAQLSIPSLAFGANPTDAAVFNFNVQESDANIYGIQMFKTANWNQVTIWWLFGPGPSPPSGTISMAPTTAYQLLIESDGEWVSYYVNGQLLSQVRRFSATTTSLALTIKLNEPNQGGANTTTSVKLATCMVEYQNPFLQRGSDKGDYVLPGTASTYPVGGLHARYSNNSDLSGDANPLSKIHAPQRMQSYGGNTTHEYFDQLDATVNQQWPPTPGVMADASLHGIWWSAVWFGSVYLKLSAGSYTFTINTAAGGQYVVRVWVGKTKLGDQIIDQWAWANQASYNGTASIVGLSGTLSYGKGTVARDGWYPIKVEYATGPLSGGDTAYPAPQLAFTPPASYVDPGGATINAAAQVIPATSLSPLGCVDQRYQAISHFDLVQQTQQAYSYQIALEPKQLESGQFPGTLAPRIREGQDTDAVLEPDRGPRQDALLLFGPRQAFTWPLPGSLVASRWRPGDGLRVQNADINVWDTAPRQILTFTRNFVPGGTASAQVSLAQRPRTAARTLKQALYGVSRLARNYQKQLVTLTGTYVAGVSTPANGITAQSAVAILPQDVLVNAYVRFMWGAGSGANWHILFNGSNATNSLYGVALFDDTAVPTTLDLMALATAYQGRQFGGGIYVQLQNMSAGALTAFDFQLFVDVLR
jgi:hypothetical protein